MSEAPVVTMDENDVIVLNGMRIGYATAACSFASWFENVWTPAELRAIADFLDQLAGANLLSEVTAG